MYRLVPEKPLRLVYGTFYLAIGDIFYEFIFVKYEVFIKDEVLNLQYFYIEEAVSKCSILFEIKEGENFNHRNTLSISRIALKLH